MGIIDAVKEALVPDTEPGVGYECGECGERFDEVRESCPSCGSSEIKEVEGFDMRPDD